MRANARSVAAVIALVLAGVTTAQAAQQETSFTLASRYDPGGRLLGRIAPDPDASGPLRLLAERYTYSNGQLVSIESGQLASWPDETVAPSDWGGYGFVVFGSIEYAYDSYGRTEITRTRGTDGTLDSLLQYGYNDQNLVECSTVRMNPATYASTQPAACSVGIPGADGPDRITRYTYDDLDQVLTEQRAYGTDLAQTYMSNTYVGRQLRTQTDANNNRTELEYDSFGRLFRRYYPSATSRLAANPNDYNEYTYELNGNVRTERKRSGAFITYSYDRNNRLTDKTLSDRTHSDDVRYDYDLRGLMRATYFASSPEIGVFNEFDGLGRLEAATSTMRADNLAVLTRTLTYAHDADGNRTRVTHPDGVYFEYSYDGLNRLDGVLENGTASLLSVAYGAEGKRSAVLRPSGGSTGYDFDNAGRLEYFTQQFTGTTNDLTNTFSYNAARQLTQLTLSNTLYHYTGAADLAGHYKANGLNQYTVINGQSLAHDVNGNLTGDGTLGYVYDMENRLVGTSGVSAGLRYDPMGRLVEIAVIPGSITHFLYDGDVLVAEYTVSGGNETRTRRYVHGNGADEPWVQYNGSAVGPAYRRYLHADHQGSIIAQSDNTAAVLVRNSYDAFGIPNINNNGRFGYTGQLWLPELGLNYYRARMYSPQLGRFLQTDPIGYADNTNLYAYVGNDPMNRVDVFGLRACPPDVDHCYEDPEFMPEAQPPPVAEGLQEIEQVIVTARKDRKMTDGTRINLGRTDDEQGFRVTKDGIVSKPLTQKGWQKCDDGSSRRAGKLDVSGMGEGEHAGHTHPQGRDGDISGLPGPEDGQVAAATRKTAYVISSRGAFAVESTSAGFRIRQLTEGKLSSSEISQMQNQIEAWNQNNGASGRKCKFTPD